MASILVDHGYNPTPAWNTTGSFLANRVPVQRLLALALIDVALLLAAAAAIRASFGVEAALAAAAFFGVNAFAAFSITGGLFLRYDWLLGLVAALCLIRRGRYAGAGFFLAYAALVLWIGLDESFAVRATALASLAFLMYLLALLASELILQRKRLARRFASLHPGHR
jgi:hypothetical protein